MAPDNTDEATMLNKQSIKTKVAMGFGALLVILITVSAISYYSTIRAAKISELSESTSREMIISARVEDALDRRVSGIRGFLLTGKGQGTSRIRNS